LCYIHIHLEYESQQRQQQRLQDNAWLERNIYQETELATMRFLHRLKALWSKPRNRRACLAAFIVMASQQLCGVSYPEICLGRDSLYSHLRPMYSTRILFICPLQGCKPG
jgi:hypothetical protein